MVSRSNLSGRPGMGGVLGKVFKPPTQRLGKRAIQAPTEGGGGFFGKIREAVEAKQATQMPARGTMTRRAAQAQEQGGGIRQALARGAKAKSAMQAPVAGEKRGPRREPTAGEQARATRQAVAGMRGQAQAQAQQTGLEKMSETQEEMAARQSGFEEARAGGRGILSPQQEAARNRAALETTGEAGGTRTEVDVTEPSLNQARRQRSRSGRIYRR